MGGQRSWVCPSIPQCRPRLTSTASMVGLTDRGAITIIPMWDPYFSELTCHIRITPTPSHPLQWRTLGFPRKSCQMALISFFSPPKRTEALSHAGAVCTSWESHIRSPCAPLLELERLNKQPHVGSVGSLKGCNSLPPGGWREAGKDEETPPHREGRDPHSGRRAMGAQQRVGGSYLGWERGVSNT